MKKIYRIINKFTLFILIKLISKILKQFKFSIIPQLNNVAVTNFTYSDLTRRLIFNKNKKIFNSIIIDSTLTNTKLCDIGKKYGTNKSPINLNGHRIGYTGIYSLLFSQIKNKKVNFAEIGIEKNASIKMWREYFSLASIYAFEYDDLKIAAAKKNNLRKTFYFKINVKDEKSINQSFYKTRSKFDIIIDDSTHNFNDQIRVIKNCYKFLNPGGILIIEDIFKYKKEHAEINYYKNLKNFIKFFTEIFFIDTEHVNNFTSNYKCEKIFVLIKK
jgi:SAM-dependent methyltransferase